MGLSIQATRVALRTTTGTQDITISGFGTPKAAICIVTSATADGTRADNVIVSIGFTDGTNGRSVSITTADNTSTTDANREQQLLAINGISAIDDFQASFDSWVTDGMRINFASQAPDAAYLMTVIFLAGSDLSVNVGTIATSNTVGTTASVSGLSYEPDVVLFTGMGHNSAAAVTHSVFSFAVAVNDGSLTQRCLASCQNDNVATTVSNQFVGTDRVGGQLYNNAFGWYADLTAFNSDGFTLTTRSTASGADWLLYIALNFNSAFSFAAGTLTLPTSTGNSAVSGLGFTPQMLLSAVSTAQSLDTIATSTDADGWCVGVADGTAEFCNAIVDGDNLSTSNSFCISDNQIINLDTDDAGTAADLADATLSSFDSGGFTLNYSTAPATATYGWYLAIGTAAASGTAPTSHLYGPLVGSLGGPV